MSFRTLAKSHHTPSKSTDRPSDAYVQSFARGLSVIRTFNAQRPEQTLTDVANAAGLTRAGARRILLTLVTLGYVEVDGRLFRLTPRILDLGFSYLTSLPFWNLAEPIIENLAAQVHESSSAAVLDGDEIVYVLRVPTHKIMTINLSIGSRLPALWTSMGRVLLSGLDESELEKMVHNTELQPYTAQTIVNPDALLEEIRKARKQGWALVNEELEEGLISISAPIRNRQGRIIAAINVSGHARRKTATQVQKAFLAPLLASSEQISALLSGKQ